MIDDDLEMFLHTITDDDIISRMDKDLAGEEKFLFVYREEIMKTVIDGRYSGMYIELKRIFLSIQISSYLEVIIHV